jgi:methylmalonyl-CoA mutase N-terminal domain/subunit
MGGSVKAIEERFMQHEIEDAAYRINEGIEDGGRIVVGVNKFASERDEPVELQGIDPELARRQVERTKRIRAERDQGVVDKALAALGEAARSGDNLLYPMKDALAAYATLGEVSDVLREVFGEYEPRAL